MKPFAALKDKLTDPPRQAMSIALLALLVAGIALLMVVHHGR